MTTHTYDTDDELSLLSQVLKQLSLLSQILITVGRIGSNSEKETVPSLVLFMGVVRAA